MTYLVNDVYTCIQGEGCQTGLAMVLVRLHGCGVGCPWCDTKETWEIDEANQVGSLTEALGGNLRYTAIGAEQLAAYVKEHCEGPRWILLTGGEPADQELKPLVDAFHERGYQVALETSGTAVGHVKAGCDWVCCSPKIDMPGGRAIVPEAVAVADEIKFVVGRERDLDKLDTFLSSYPLKKDVEISLQPLSLNRSATDLCVRMAQARGWRVSIQMHKYIGQP